MTTESIKHNFPSLYHNMIPNNEIKINLVNGIFTTFLGSFSGAIANGILSNEPLDACVLSVNLAITLLFFQQIPRELFEESQVMKIYRIGCFALGFLFGFSSFNIVRTAMYAQTGLFLIDKISRCNFQNLTSQINCIPNLKRNFNNVVQKSIEIYPYVREKFIFIFWTPSEEERIRKGREWMAEYLQLLKNNNSKDFDQIGKLKEFIQSDPELLTSYTNSLKNTLIFVKPFESYLGSHEDELTNLSNQSSFFYNFKMDFKKILRENPDFLQLLQIKLMQKKLNKPMLEWIEEPKCIEIENEIII